MGKTNFQNGTIVQPEFLNSIYDSSGGHSHNAENNDGSSKKINLSTDVSGVLHKNNIGTHIHDGDIIEQIVPYRDIAGNVSGKFPITILGFEPGPTGVEISYNREYIGQDGKHLITLAFPSLAGEPDPTTFLSGQHLPESFRPSISQWGFCPILTSHVTIGGTFGSIEIKPTGVVWFRHSKITGDQIVSLEAWLGVTGIGVGKFVIQYEINPV